MKLGSAIKIAAMANERREIARELRTTKRFDLRREIIGEKIERRRNRWELMRGKRCTRKEQEKELEYL